MQESNSVQIVKANAEARTEMVREIALVTPVVAKWLGSALMVWAVVDGICRLFGR